MFCFCSLHLFLHTALPCIVDPGKPKDITISVNDISSNVTVAWTPPTDKGGGQISNYMVCI